MVLLLTWKEKINKLKKKKREINTTTFKVKGRNFGQKISSVSESFANFKNVICSFYFAWIFMNNGVF